MIRPWSIPSRVAAALAVLLGVLALAAGPRVGIAAAQACATTESCCCCEPAEPAAAPACCPLGTSGSSDAAPEASEAEFLQPTSCLRCVCTRAPPAPSDSRPAGSRAASSETTPASLTIHAADRMVAAVIGSPAALPISRTRASHRATLGVWLL